MPAPQRWRADFQPTRFFVAPEAQRQRAGEAASAGEAAVPIQPLLTERQVPFTVTVVTIDLAPWQGCGIQSFHCYPFSQEVSRAESRGGSSPGRGRELV